ncbi:MAG: hypothetical protein B7Z43_11695 [Sphingomonas sp. 12-62-6]|nr:MAG: hypothetical protein B7Z43_11695 [Sphingomonas sp. 12-62-6]
MFGRTKPKLNEEKLFAGWRMMDICYLADSFSNEYARLSFEISGIRHSTRFKGDDFASVVRISRSEHELYNNHALAFDYRPANEDSHSLAVHEHELVGFTSYPRARMRCQVCVGNLEEIKNGNLGSLSVTGEKIGTASEAYQPIITAHFNVQTVEQEIDLRRTMQAALAGRGNAFINFMLYPIDNAVGRDPFE